MAGDYTRFTFEPTKGFSGLHKQQGRVSLDSDFNEYEEILDRHTRSEMYDTVGQAVYPATTPNGFAIGISGTQLTIGIGRMYVDGIQVECFGDMSFPAATVFKRHVGGVHGSGPLLYSQQPFFYAPNFPALSPTAGVINLVYLDVWQREVTVYEDEDLREVALNGPDTATRVQTAWQVKVLQGADANSCTTPPPSWAALIAPSTARINAVAIPAGPAPGPCIINPAGGYTGLENRLYRVEVHRAGTLGGVGPARAQFKWSRDNASLAARVLSIGPGPLATQSVITVASTGRDSWMRFEPNDRLELLDDHVEFAMRETSIGGSMARVLAVNHATGEITIDQNLTAFAIVTARHPRIRRWDYANIADPLVRDTNNGVAIPLENGISVTFGSSNTDTLHAGDFWVFAARTADGTIDTLDNAPPRGILHHFARLGLVTSGAPPTVLSDCRIPWPPNTGCCTAVVRPGQSIQAAIDSLPPEGGCVCLKVGIHNITAPIELNRSNVHLHGESEGAEIRGTGLEAAIHIKPTGTTDLHDVMVEHLRIVMASGGPGGAIVAAENVNRLEIRGVEIEVTYAGKFPDSYAGIFVNACTDIVVEGNATLNAPWGVYIRNVAVRSLVVRNTLVGPRYNLAALSVPMGQFGVWFASDVRADHRVEHNHIRNFLTGVMVEQGTSGVTIAWNRIVRAVESFSSGDPLPTTPAALRAYLNDPNRYYAIDVLGGSHSRVHDNYMELNIDQFGGIRVLVEQVLVRANHMISTVTKIAAPMPPAIYCGEETLVGTGTTGSGSTIIENIIQGGTTGIVVSRCVGVALTNNRIDGQGSGWFAVRLDDCSYTTVTGTLVASVPLSFVLSEGDHNVCNDNRTALTAVGFGVTDESDLTLSGNEITGAIAGAVLASIESGDFVISRNRMVNCGSIPFGPTQGAIAAMANLPVTGILTTFRVESNEIIDSGVSVTGAVSSTAVRGIHGWFPNCHVIDNRVTSMAPNLSTGVEHRALLLLGPLNAMSPAFFSAGFAALPPIGGSALVSGNVFRGKGNTHLVQLFRTDPVLFLGALFGFWFDKAVFSSNVCEHVTDIGINASTVELGVRSAAVSANTVTAPTSVVSISGTGFARGSVAANATTGDIAAFAPLSPTPAVNFNVRI